MAEIARSTHIPFATGERVFTKWGFLEVLQKRAATVLQPDLCHAGGITEVRLIAGMAASIPNFLCQEQASLGVGYLKKPFEIVNGHVPLPTAPELGIELDENAMADKIGHDWKNPESYDADDGSVVDW
jgi:galactonate dehydratase